jgi:hypothetical protein
MKGFSHSHYINKVNLSMEIKGEIKFNTARSGGKGGAKCKQSGDDGRGILENSRFKPTE